MHGENPQGELALTSGSVFFVAAETDVAVDGGDSGIEIYRAYCE